jgi:sugar phosphate isomerase/epimerase
MGFKLPIADELALAAKTGYQGVEPWIRELDAHAKAGKSLADLGKLRRDLGLEFPSAIGFFPWVVDDDAERKKGFEEAKRNMDLLRQIGGTWLAAPPAGATETEGLDLRKIAERYHSLLELGREMGVTPEVELWGFSKTLGRLAEVAFVAVESGHPDACILPDVYHMYKGGSPPEGLRLLNGRAIPAIHMNDYPADPPRETIADADRVYPGDGVAPLGQILRDLEASGFEGHLSLELFNREYWKRDPESVAREGIEKMRGAVASAFGAK